MSEETEFPYAVEVAGLGSVVVVAHAGDTYEVALNGRVYGYAAQNGTPSAESAAADIAYALAHPPAFPSVVDDRPIGMRVGLTGEFHHSEVSTLAGQTYLGLMPWGWAPSDIQGKIGTAFNQPVTLAFGTAGSPGRYATGIPTPAGFFQRTPLDLKPLSALGGTPIFITKSATTTVGEIIKASFIIERKFLL